MSQYKACVFHAQVIASASDHRAVDPRPSVHRNRYQGNGIIYSVPLPRGEWGENRSGELQEA